MKRAILILAALGALLFCSGDSQAGIACSGFGYNPVAFDFELITVSTTALGFTATKISPSGGNPATYANCTLETNPIRQRSDGLNPTSSVGQLITAGQTLEACGEQSVKSVRFIRQGAADGTLQCHYYRFPQ